MKNNYKPTNIALTFIACTSFLFLYGCGSSAAIGKLSTPSGKPEVTIPNSNVQSVMDNVATWLAAQGRSISGSGMYTISSTFSKRATNNGIFYAMMPFESTYTIVQNGADVELYEKTFNTSDNGASAQTEQSDYDEMQKELMQIAGYIKTK